jgi:Protein of unknown function (DUF5818)
MSARTGFDVVPLGSEHHESGLLIHGAHSLLLQRDEGGRWRLDAPRKAHRLVGRRVTIEGKRSGFDRLDVDRIYPEGQPPKQSFILSWQFGAGVLSVFALLLAVIVIMGNQ